jgi:glutamate-1-semialdehyde 2,1-aminomutase
MVQAGTLSGNPVAMSAAIATLEALDEPGLYEELERKSARLADGIASAAADAGVQLTCNRVGSMLTAFFADRPMRNADDVAHADRAAYARFFHAMLDRGVALAPSYCEAAFLSTAHSDTDVERVIETARAAFVAAREG